MRLASSMSCETLEDSALHTSAWRSKREPSPNTLPESIVDPPVLGLASSDHSSFSQNAQVRQTQSLLQQGEVSQGWTR